MSLEFFDANVVVGVPRNQVDFAPLATSDDLHSYIGHQGLRGALIWHWAQMESHPRTGNGLITDYLSTDPAVYPCWSLLPPATEEPLGMPGDLLECLPAAVRLFPEAHRYLMARVVWGDLLDELARQRIPVLLSLQHAVTWPQIYALLSAYPDLTCVLCDLGSWSMDRYTYPLLQAYPNVHVETSMLSLEDGGVEAMVDRFGPERLLFGTGFPKRYAEASMLQLTHADLRDQDKRAIAAGNMLRLLERSGENA